jgi:hypothetical protein
MTSGSIKRAKKSKTEKLRKAERVEEPKMK